MKRPSTISSRCNWVSARALSLSFAANPFALPDPEQPELAFFIGKWNAYNADNDKQYSAHYQQRALECL